MKNLLISAFAICLAMAVPTALMADDHHDNKTPKGMMGGPGVTHNKGMPKMGGGMKGPSHHTYQFNSSNDTRGHMTMGHHAVVDVSKFRRNVTASRHFHWGDYHGPADYSYRRWSYGDNLPAEYWGQDYWIENFLNFGLDAPPDGYVWVRYGPDALLIDEDTGEVVQVEYGLFY